MSVKRVCVFCGANESGRADYAQAAETMGRLLAVRGLGLVYGGTSVGLMGRMANAALDAGGEVIGVIPETLTEKEMAHPGLDELIVVQTLHERKRRMFERADAFVALPGGLGTLDELSEMLTWAQLGFHAKPIGLVNAAGYYDALVAFLDHAVMEGLMRPEHRALLAVGATPRAVLGSMGFQAEPVKERLAAGS